MDQITSRRKRCSRSPLNPITRRRRFSSVDRLSYLPDDLLITILSSTLTLKEAARTSTLSKRWKTLWTYYYGFFNFDYHSHLRFEKRCSSSYRLFEECTSEYVDYVNKVLNSHQDFGVPINKFRICWMMHKEFKTVMDLWIDFAMKKRVKHIELDLCVLIDYSNYKFPQGIGFPNLTVLKLASVDVTDETLAYLLSSDKCPLLQHISIKYVRSLKHVKVVGNFNLKSLVFDNCCAMKDVKIISAVNMVTFGYSGRENTKITFKDVPLLTKALFGFDNFIENPMMQNSFFLSQLEILVLDLYCSNYLPTYFPKFDRLKRLELQAYTPYFGYKNKCVMALIYGCPRLQKFSLKMSYRDIDGRSDSHKKIHYKHRHKCLQVVEYIGWNGNAYDMELITDIVKNTVRLDKVTIDPRRTFYDKFHEIEEKFYDRQFHVNDKKREASARKAAKKLLRILPQRVTLVIV